MAQFSPHSPGTYDKRSASSGFLTIENLVKSFPSVNGQASVVLDNINLTIGEDEFISIIGHSGCGKSTLLRIVAGLEKATSGTVRLNGREIRQPGAERMVVFQQYSLLPWMTVRDNIRLAVDEVLKKASPGEKKKIVNEHLAMVNLAEAANKYPDELSGGMKQRVGIARALAIRPKMLLMDEPFGALDALTRGRLQRQVLDIWENQRQAVMMITHDVDEALYMSDRIVLMTNAPRATIGEILVVPFAHPRDRSALRETSAYRELRNQAMNFLNHYFD
ncbi:MAG TPA: ABC transporter ATP-binding protein [Candidatus Caenarcaniphilales bacterium]